MFAFLFAGVFLDSPADFTVDAAAIDKNGNGKVRAIVSSPSGAKAELPIENHKDGTYSGSYMPLEQGKSDFKKKENTKRKFNRI